MLFEGLLRRFVQKKRGKFCHMMKKSDIEFTLACIFVDICEASCTQEAPGGTEKAVHGIYAAILCSKRRIMLE